MARSLRYTAGMRFRVFATADDLAEALAGRILSALGEGPKTALMLAGGRTPLAAYGRLAGRGPAGCEWPRVFLSDERVAPLDSPATNHFHVAPLLAAAGAPPGALLAVDTRQSPEEAAAALDRRLARWVAEDARFPFGVLGVGADGHTASLFSLDDVGAARVHERYAVAVLRPAPPHRVSATPHLFAMIEELVFAVSGAEKAGVVARLREAPLSVPAGAAVAGHPNVTVWADAAAAGGMPPS